MRGHLVVLGILLTALLAPSSSGAEFLPLPDLVGPVEYDDALQVSFDLGQEYSEVRDVLIMIEASGTPLTFEYCGEWPRPQPCELQVREPEFIIRLDSPGYDPSALVGRFRSDRAEKKAGVFGRAFLDFDFDHLRDGRGTLTLYWNGVAFTPESIIQDFTPPTAVISAATLIVDGTPLPEPAVALQLGTGSLLLALLRRMGPHRRGSGRSKRAQG